MMETPQSPSDLPMRPPDTGPPPETGPPPVQATSPSPQLGQPQLTNIRFSDNAGKTRIVIETRGAMPYAADLDNAENILTISFANGGAGIDVSSLPVGSKLLKNVSGTPQSSGGYVLAFTLNRGSRIINQGTIAPNADNTSYRIYIDLAN
jgi:hypothetical protein